jgi:phosphoglucomutase/phosphomannomutase
MSNSTEVVKVSELLSRKYGSRGERAVELLEQWLSGNMPFAYPEIIVKHLSEQRIDLLFDCFWQVLPFGTGGRRGRVGYGANRLNPTTVAMTIQGHCQYLKRAFGERKNLSVVVANDVRVFKDIAGVYRFLGNDHPLLGVSSRSLAKLACEIYASNGIIAYLAAPKSDQAVLSTPELSFLIGELHAIGGINLSASHNPPDDNGLKVYDEYGSQPIAPNDQLLVEAMNQVREVKPMAFETALKNGLIREVPKELHATYVDTYEKIYGGVYTPVQDIPIVYTPLCGCGLTTVGDVLHRLQFPVLTPPNEVADGSFAVIPFKAPNPEVPQATEPAKAFADAHGSGVVLSSDPDADRVGLEAKLPDGSWYHFDGNQIAAILCYYLMLDPAGPRRKGLVIETLVTTKILGKIVEKAGGSQIIDDLLVGFKYVANVLKTLEREGRYRHVTASPSQLVLAAEESHGVIVVPTIRDKDATPACMYLAALYQQLHQKGVTLLDYYVRILEEFGGYDTVNRSITMAGAEGVLRRDKIMESLRQSRPKTLGGQDVRKVVDFWDQHAFGPFVSETDRLPRNVLQLFTDHFIITIRPSGTEPKLKFYCQLLPSGKQSGLKGMELLREVRAKSDAISLKIYNDLLKIIGLRLSKAGLLLPDIIDLDRKQSFDRKAVRKLREALRKGKFASLEDALAWLRKETAAMTPGADPLPALKAPLAHICRQRLSKINAGNLCSDLGKWANK